MRGSLVIQGCRWGMEVEKEWTEMQEENQEGRQESQIRDSESQRRNDLKQGENSAELPLHGCSHDTNTTALGSFLSLFTTP